MGCRVSGGCSHTVGHSPSILLYATTSTHATIRQRISRGLVPCCASSGNEEEEEEEFKDRMEEIMASAKELRQKYFDLMAEASAMRGGDQAHSVREELFQMSLQELQASLGVYEDGGTEEDEGFRIVEEFASMIERGEEIPPPPEGMYYEEKESAESFTQRLRTGFEIFKDVVQGRIKPGHLLDGEEDEDEELLTDVPEEKSRFVPDIPQRAMDMYTFGERVMYILRRGYQTQTLSKPIELLDSYGLLLDDVVLETRWTHVVGKDAVKRYCFNVDRIASSIKCSNLLMSYPKFTVSDTEVIAEGTSDIIMHVPVPTWYTSFCTCTGKGLNSISVEEQISLGIDVPDVLFPWNATESYCEEKSLTLPTTRIGYTDCLDSTEILSDQHWSSPSNHQKHVNSGHDVAENMDITPDDAEEILQSLFGDDFDAIAQQLPKKQSVPPHVDPEYQPLFEEDDPNHIKCAVIWTFQVDLIARKVTKIGVEYSWINMGHVHEEDVFYVLTIETGEYLCMLDQNMQTKV